MSKTTNLYSLLNYFAVFYKIHQKYEGDSTVVVGRVNCKEHPRLCKKVRFISLKQPVLGNHIN